MKKRLLSILLMCCMVLTLLPVAAFAEGETGVAINETNFPDANFRTVVKEYDTDKDENLSRLEIEAVKEIKCYYKDIRSLIGIEYFTALQTLKCYSNLLTSLDISRNTALKSLDCAKNQLAALDVSQNTALESLDCTDNQLTSLDVSRNTALKSLDCANNQLTSLDVSRNTALESLNCADNQLTALDISQNTALESLICAGNKLTALNVSGNATLEFLNCRTNELTELNVDQNAALNTLDCADNQLTSLNVSLNLNLQDLNCAKNKLAALDVQKNTALNSLYCGYNQLTVLDVGQNGSLENLSCNNNLLTSLDVRQNTRLNLLLCYNNHLTSLDTSNQKWLHTLSCNNNNYPITITNDRNYDLSDLPGTFDVNKASNWSGGTVSGNNILTVDHDKDSVTYTYDCGNGRTANFTLTVENKVEEQFTLTPGGRYYFDLSAMDIPGTANSNLPDSTLHYVPFTYAGTMDAYKLTSEMATTEEYAQQGKYPHSLFVADYTVTHTISWNDLNTAGLIFGKDYVAGGVGYTLRAPSVGSGHTGSGDIERGTPQSNEWDAVLDKNSGYIKNWNGIYSWGQDTTRKNSSNRAVRGYTSARFWLYITATSSYPSVGFRPVLEVLNPDTLDSDGLKVVTLDLGGGTLGNSSKDIQIIVKTGSEFTAPASDGMTRPDGDTGNFFMWRGSNGKFYVPGDSVPADVTALTVQWTAPTYTVTLHANGGTINSGNVTGYTYGVGATLPTAGDMTREGYTFAGWYDNEALTGNPITEISTDETGNRTYWAKWTINQYTITYDLDGGTAEGNPDSYTIETDTFTLKNPTKSGYTFTGWSGTGLTGENNLTVTIEKGSTGNRSYTAHWHYNGGGSSGYSYYTIKATAGTGGSISPSGSVSVREGRDQTFTITPDKGYAVSNVKIDGKSIGAVKSYTFENVSRTHTIEVIFMKANGNPQTGVFVDVATGSYYEDAVDWAVGNGITQGTDDTHFSPDGICTRAQAVTFLWRAAGSPKPETRTMPFADVPVGSYYYDAVLWAVENGIAKGTSDTTFSPNMTCTRAQIVAFLWRSEKSPAAGTANPFADVKSTAYYADAVLWAVKENITKGTTSTTFSPNADCTRAQIVTFLWRCKK